MLGDNALTHITVEARESLRKAHEHSASGEPCVRTTSTSYLLLHHPRGGMVQDALNEANNSEDAADDRTRRREETVRRRTHLMHDDRDG